jgi:hypothetical protein
MAKTVFDELLAGMGSAIADIREKVVEEAYFGRVVTDSVRPGVAPTAPESPGTSFQEYAKETARNAPARDEIGPKDHDIDR